MKDTKKISWKIGKTGITHWGKIEKSADGEWNFTADTFDALYNYAEKIAKIEQNLNSIVGKITADALAYEFKTDARLGDEPLKITVFKF